MTDIKHLGIGNPGEKRKASGVGTNLNPWIPHVNVEFPDGAALDSFSRQRVSNPLGIFDNKNVSSRNRDLWEEKISGVIVVYNTLVGTFQAAEEVRGALPANIFPIGTINTDNGSSSMNVDIVHNEFQVGDTITGQTSGATAIIVSANTGSDIQHNYDRSSVFITVGTASGDISIRQTHRYHAYVPGKSHLCVFTFIIGNAKANVRKRVGYFDALNGLFLEQNSTTDVALVLRTSTSGSAVDTRTTQANWNLDKFDGTGVSGITLDLTKTQILIIDFQWLGVGRVRYGFDIDGSLHYVHEILNANVVDVTYMKTPTLPSRYEIENLAATASQTILEEICCSIASEGGYKLPGLQFAKSADITPRNVSTTLTPVFAIRLKNNFPAGEPNRKAVMFLSAGLFASAKNVHMEFHHINEPIDITATWNDVLEGSAVEFSTDITAVTGRPAHIVDETYVDAGAGQSSNVMIATEFISQHSFISQSIDSDNSKMFVVMAQALTATANVFPFMKWIEFE